MDREIKKKRRRSGLKICLGILLLIIAGLLIAASAVFKFDEWHGFDPKLILDCDRSLLVYDSDGGLICAAGAVKRIRVGLEELSPSTVNAFISAEDNRFFKHEGVDLYRILGAAWADIKAGGYVQGASTISQQLIKLSHLSNEKTLDRKLEEAVLAHELEMNFSKDEILEMYLNYVYFGGGYYGIEAASLGYFGRHASELSTAQAAQLAGILKSPSVYAPHIDLEASLARRDSILRKMHENGYLNDSELSQALGEECVILREFPAERTCFIDYAVREAAELLDMDVDELTKSGMKVYTTLDSGLSELCSELMNDDTSFPAENAQGALAVLRSDGSIAAMLGGRGAYESGSLNRAVDIERQPGSLIKPVLVYAPALQCRGYTAATLLVDEPKSFGDYSPRNSDGKYYGVVTLREAVTRSLNIPAVSVLADVGLPNAVMFAQRMGISFEGESVGLALALGGFTHGVSPIEMAGAYCAIADGGVYIKPTAIERIISADGRLIYDRSLSGERVMSRENAYILTSMLQSVAAEGTGKRLAATGLGIAAKTGTAVDAGGVRDAWCAAFTSEYTAVCWMGTDNAASGSLPEDAVGGSFPAVLLGKVFEGIYHDRACPDFEKPEDVEECTIDTYAASENRIYLANELTPLEYARKEYFISGTEPKGVNGYWREPLPPSELGWSINSAGEPVISFTAESFIFSYRLLRRSPDGSETLLAEFSGRSGYMSYTDKSALPGAMYSYYIVALHPEIKQNGTPMMSAPSRELCVIVPFVPLNMAG